MVQPSRPVTEDVVRFDSARPGAVRAIIGGHRGWSRHRTRTRSCSWWGVLGRLLSTGRLTHAPARSGDRVVLLAFGHDASPNLEMETDPNEVVDPVATVDTAGTGMVFADRDRALDTEPRQRAQVV